MDTNIENKGPANTAWLAPADALTRFGYGEAGPERAQHQGREEFVFGFRVGNLGFFVKAGTSCEVIGTLRVDSIPNTPPWFSGLLNLRGNLVPVFDLRRLLGETAANPKMRSLFVIGSGEKAVALWVDGLPEVMAALSHPLKQLPHLPDPLQAHVVEGHVHRGQVWLEIRFEDLFQALGHQIGTGCLR